MPLFTYYHPTGHEDDVLPEGIREELTSARRELELAVTDLIIQRKERGPAFAFLNAGTWWRKVRATYNILWRSAGFEYQVINLPARYNQKEEQEDWSLNFGATAYEIHCWLQGLRLGAEYQERKLP